MKKIKFHPKNHDCEKGHPCVNFENTPLKVQRDRENGWVGGDMHPVKNNIKTVQSEFLGQKFWPKK
jgi:hypothetical protein